jgi:hypothetical protein
MWIFRKKFILHTYRMWEPEMCTRKDWAIYLLWPKYWPNLQIFGKRWDSSVGTGTGYELDGRGIGFRFTAGERNFSLLHSVPAWTHPPSYPMGNGVFSPAEKISGIDLPPPSAVINDWLIPPHPTRFHGAARNKLSIEKTLPYQVFELICPLHTD